MSWRHIPVIKHPCADLLIVQLLGILIYPFLGDQLLARALFSTFALLVLVLAVMAVRMTPALNWVSGTVAVMPTTVHRVVRPALDPRCSDKLC